MSAPSACGPRPFGSGTSRKRPSGRSESSVAPHSTQRRRLRFRGGKGTPHMIRPIQACRYFLAGGVVGAGDVEVVVLLLDVEVVVLVAGALGVEVVVDDSAFLLP